MEIPNLEAKESIASCPTLEEVQRPEMIKNFRLGVPMSCEWKGKISEANNQYLGYRHTHSARGEGF